MVVGGSQRRIKHVLGFPLQPAWTRNAVRVGPGVPVERQTPAAADGGVEAGYEAHNGDKSMRIAVSGGRCGPRGPNVICSPTTENPPRPADRAKSPRHVTPSPAPVGDLLRRRLLGDLQVGDPRARGDAPAGFLVNLRGMWPRARGDEPSSSLCFHTNSGRRNTETTSGAAATRHRTGSAATGFLAGSAKNTPTAGGHDTVRSR